MIFFFFFFEEKTTNIKVLFFEAEVLRKKLKVSLSVLNLYLLRFGGEVEEPGYCVCINPGLWRVIGFNYNNINIHIYNRRTKQRCFRTTA